MSIADLASLTGLSESVYWRLEHGTRPHDVNLRALVNCALVLDVGLDDLIEDSWREWWAFDARRPRPPAVAR